MKQIVAFLRHLYFLIKLILFAFLIIGGSFVLFAEACPKAFNGDYKKEDLFNVIDNERLFYENFKADKINGENRFILIRNRLGGSAVHEILKKEDDQSFRTRSLDISSKNGMDISENIFTEYKGNRKTNVANKFIIEDGNYITAVVQAHPRVGKTLQTIHYDRERISSEDLIIHPSAKETEQQIKEAGYNSIYFTEMSKLKKWSMIKKQLVKLKPNPYKTHIDYFADLIPRHIEYIKKGVTNSNQKTLIEFLEKRAEKAVAEKRVTYNWWIKFNFALSHVFKNKFDISSIENLSSPMMDLLISRFPFEMAFPTLGSSVGIMAFNRSLFEGVHPLSLSYKGLQLNGKYIPPDILFRHDITHSLVFITRMKDVYYSTVNKRFHKLWTEEIASLPYNERRKNIELAYFISIHEKYFLNEGYFLPERLRNFLLAHLQNRAKNRFKFKGIMNFSEDPEIQQQQIEQIVSDFMKTFNKVRNILL